MTHEQFEKAAQYWENKPQTAMPQKALKKAVSNVPHHRKRHHQEILQLY